MPRFVLLYHACPTHYDRPSHWDLMLESGDALRTWALPQLPQSWQAWHEQTVLIQPDCPALAANDFVAAEQLANHRLAYLELEGPLSGDRGSVTRIAAGMYASAEETPCALKLALTTESNGWTLLLRESENAPEWLLELI